MRKEEQDRFRQQLSPSKHPKQAEQAPHTTQCDAPHDASGWQVDGSQGRHRRTHAYLQLSQTDWDQYRALKVPESDRVYHNSARLCNSHGHAWVTGHHELKTQSNICGSLQATGASPHMTADQQTCLAPVLLKNT
jgi:hypothetical protein